MEIQVSIIIVNYNCEEHTCNCIDSIYKHVTNLNFEIIVVDNASSTVNILLERYPEIKLIVNKENLGFGSANNIGVRQASGNYIFFLNPDTILLNDAVSLFYEFLKNKSNDVACCGGNLVNADGSPNISYGNFPSVLQQFSDIGFRIFYKRFYSENLSLGQYCYFRNIKKVSYLSGSAFFIKKQLFESIGGFDEHFFMYYEETDLFLRLEKAGYKSYILPDVKIIHLESVTTKCELPFNYGKWAMMEKSKYYYFTKNRNSFTSLCVRLFQIISLFVIYFHNPKKFNLKKAIIITFTA